MKSAPLLALAFALSVAAVAQTPNAPAAPAVQDEPITQPVVVYPAEAKQRHIQGVVQLEVHVSPTGEVTEVKALSGPEELRQAAIDAYQKASYKPLMRDGKAVPAVVHTSVHFNLHEEPSPDVALEKQFLPLHSQCELEVHAKDPKAEQTCEDALQIANRFTPGTHLEARAAAYNDMVVTLMNADQNREAVQLANDAITNVASLQPHSSAAAIAYISSAEAKAHAHQLRASANDCKQAETILQGLLGQEKNPQVADNLRLQLKGTLTLHAVVLRNSYHEKQARAYEAEALQY